MGRRIKWSRQAQKQRRELFLYWNGRNKNQRYSKKLNDEFTQSLKQLALEPSVGSFADEAGILKKLVRDYYLFYSYDNKDITVLFLWDTRRNPEDNPYSY